MAIELNQIHNLVRTYQWAIQLSPPARQESEQAGYVGEDQISISLDAHERNNVHLVNNVFSRN
jgi:hypothetical protein